MSILQDCFRTELKKELDLKKKKNPRYSLRAMSRDLLLSSGTLSDFLNEKRVFSFAKIEKILQTSDLALPKTRILVKKLRAAGQVKRTSLFEFYPMHERVLVDEVQLNTITEWFHFAILSLTETKDFVSDPEWIGQRLGLDPSTVLASLERLVHLGLLEMTDGEVRSTGKSFVTSDGVPCDALRRSHQENLAMAQRSLDVDPVSDRDFFSMTMAINPERLDEAKRQLRIFLDSICDLLEVDEKLEVYQAQFQLFPLSRRTKAPS